MIAAIAGWLQETRPRAFHSGFNFSASRQFRVCGAPNAKLKAGRTPSAPQCRITKAGSGPARRFLVSARQALRHGPTATEGALPGPSLLASQDIRFALAARRRPCL